jgi:hypothetical protein
VVHGQILGKWQITVAADSGVKMPLVSTADNAPTKFPNPDFLTLASFKRGVITLIDKSKLPLDALQEATNLFLVEDGQPSIRPGIDWFGAAMPNGLAIDGYDYFDFGGVIHLVAVAGGVVYRSVNNGNTWSICTGATLTSGAAVFMNQNNNFLYLTNGLDNIVRYDGSTTLQVYTVLTTPAAPTAVVTGMTGTTYTEYYKISAVSQIGFSIASPKLTVQTAQPRDTWDKTTAYVTLTMPAPQTTQTRYDIYYSQDDLNYYYLDSIISSTANPSVTYKDDGSAVIVPSTTAPIDNTTQGPKVAELVNVGSRMYGVRDPDNRYRIWFTSGSPPLGAFSSGYDGGYLDWQPGGKYIPIKVEDYRDGKGTPLATVWCDSADGQGCILQMSLDTLTVGSISITVPSAYKLPGSRGTPAPGSVVNVLNDYMFYNTQAFYNLGSRAQLLQILSTDEVSANIRPTVKTISHAAESRIATAYFDAKVYFSVPYGSDSNNATIIFDTERKAWLPTAFDVGFSKFLRYTDTQHAQHLLALKPGDNRLSQISAGISGDYGQPFNTSLLTGLYSVTKNRFQFQFTEEMEYEFSNPQGSIYLELLGIDRVKGFSSIKTAHMPIVSTVSDTGWDNYNWDTHNWDDTSVVPTVVSESSIKRYTPVQAYLNAIQWHIYTNSLDARYVLRTLQTWGTLDEGGHPAPWRIKAE